VTVVALVVLCSVALIVRARGARAERMRLAAVTGTWEYQWPPANVPWQLRSTLTMRPDGRWVRENDYPDRTHEHLISHDSGSFGLTGVNLVLRSEIGEQPTFSQYTVSGDTIFTRTAEMAARLEMLSGKPIRATETMFLRTSR
jgi:hypothetical protein